MQKNTALSVIAFYLFLSVVSVLFHKKEIPAVSVKSTYIPLLVTLPRYVLSCDVNGIFCTVISDSIQGSKPQLQGISE